MFSCDLLEIIIETVVHLIEFVLQVIYSVLQLVIPVREYIASVLLTLQLIDAVLQRMNSVKVVVLPTIVIRGFRRLGNFFFLIITQQPIKQKYFAEKTQK